MNEKLDLLKELTDGEDEFDADLMACGCRYAGAPQVTLQVIDLEDVINLYGLTDQKLHEFIAGLIDECNIEAAKVLQIAERISSGVPAQAAT